MRGAILTFAALAVLLAGCGPAAPAPVDPSGETTDSPTEPIVGLPDDAALVLTATATAGNGAVLDISLVVRSPQPFDADGAADAWATTTAWCVGEVDDSVISGEGYSFTTVDVTATPVEGEWPAETPLGVSLAMAPGSTIAADGSLRQINASAEVGAVNGSVPHCRQPVVLDGAGAGHFYIGIPGDVDGDGDGTPPLGGWTKQPFGVTANIAGSTEASDLVLSDCLQQVTPLGDELGAPLESWTQDFTDSFCGVRSRQG
jgi:hypothetical protein